MTSAGFHPTADHGGPRASGGGGVPGVSVIIPSYQGRSRITACLRSLARQTLESDLFEVVVVLNGQPDGTLAVLELFQKRNPWLDIKVIEVPVAGTSNARNIGITAASRQYTTFIDDDDTVSAHYLEKLLLHAGPMTISLAQIVDIRDTGRVDSETPINLQTVRYSGRLVHPERVPRALGFNACKLIPTDLVKSVKYDNALQSGVDVVFFMTLLAHHDFDIHVCAVENGPEAKNAVYYRLLRPNSMSRRNVSFEFNILGRLEVISRLNQLRKLCDERRERVIRTTISAQAGLMRRYLEAKPDDSDRVFDAIESYGIIDFPYHSLEPANIPPSSSRR